MTYTEADTILRTTKGRYKNEQRKIARNTWLIRHDHCIVIRFHATNILEFYPDGRTVVNVHGWTTPTTKERINTNRPPGMPWVYSYLGQWYLSTSSRTEPLTYECGMTIHSDGRIEGHGIGMRPWDAILELARDLRSHDLMWPSAQVECTEIGSLRASYDAMCDDLEVPRQRPPRARANTPLHRIIQSWNKGMIVLKEAAA